MRGKTHISGSLLMSAMAAMGIPKLLTGPQKSVARVSALSCYPVRVFLLSSVLLARASWCRCPLLHHPFQRFCANTG